MASDDFTALVSITDSGFEILTDCVRLVESDEGDFFIFDNSIPRSPRAFYRLEEIAHQKELARLKEERKKREQKQAEERARLAKIKAAEQAKQAQITAQKRAAQEARNRELAQIVAQKRAAQEARNRELAAQREKSKKQKAEASRQAALAQKIASGPILSRKKSPSYPRSARTAKLEGTTRILATITTSGKVSSPRVVSSSGHRSLDSAALKAVKKWRFTPAKNGLGQSIPHQITIPVVFKLQ